MNTPWQNGFERLARASQRLQPAMSRVSRRLRPVEHMARTTSFALGMVPLSVQKPGLSLALNHAMQELIDAGELDFLDGRCCTISVRDRRLQWPLTMQDGRLTLTSDQPADVTISATVPAFLALISQQVDPDTLFFQRQLSIEGDVELGLHVKNLLDSLDDDDLPPLWQQALKALRQALIMEKPLPKSEQC